MHFAGWNPRFWWFCLDANGHMDGHTDGHMDGLMDRPSYRDARMHLKETIKILFKKGSNGHYCSCPPIPSRTLTLFSFWVFFGQKQHARLWRWAHVCGRATGDYGQATGNGRAFGGPGEGWSDLRRGAWRWWRERYAFTWVPSKRRIASAILFKRSSVRCRGQITNSQQQCILALLKNWFKTCPLQSVTAPLSK